MNKRESIEQIRNTYYQGKFFELLGIKKLKNGEKITLTIFYEPVDYFDIEKIVESISSDLYQECIRDYTIINSILSNENIKNVFILEVSNEFNERIEIDLIKYNNELCIESRCYITSDLVYPKLHCGWLISYTVDSVKKVLN